MGSRRGRPTSTRPCGSGERRHAQRASRHRSALGLHHRRGASAAPSVLPASLATHAADQHSPPPPVPPRWLRSSRPASGAGSTSSPSSSRSWAFSSHSARRSRPGSRRRPDDRRPRAHSWTRRQGCLSSTLDDEGARLLSGAIPCPLRRMHRPCSRTVYIRHIACPAMTTKPDEGDHDHRRHR